MGSGHLKDYLCHPKPARTVKSSGEDLLWVMPGLVGNVERTLERHAVVIIFYMLLRCYFSITIIFYFLTF